VLLPGERPPNKLAAALTGGIGRSLLGGADTARGAGAVHCTSQYVSDADKARNNKKDNARGNLFMHASSSALQP
jgi:hypothetical protein